MMDDDAWFVPKRFGIGVVPVRWQGWALVAGYIVLAVVLDRVLRVSHRDVEIALLAIVTLGLIVIVAHHTRGGLRWRWGDES